MPCSLRSRPIPGEGAPHGPGNLLREGVRRFCLCPIEAKIFFFEGFSTAVLVMVGGAIVEPMPLIWGADLEGRLGCGRQCQPAT